MRTKSINFSLMLVGLLMFAIPAFSQSSLEVFERELYPLLQKNCTACHSERNIGPAHSSSDVEQSHMLVKSFVDFFDISSSTFVSKSTDEHWNDYLEAANLDSSPVKLSGDELESAISIWWEDGILPELVQDKILLSNKSLASLAEIGKSVELEWSLEEVSGELGDVRLIATVERFQGANISHFGSYRITNLRVDSLDHPISISGIHVLINDRIDIRANNFSQLETVIDPRHPDTLILSNSAQIVFARSASSDQLSFAIDSISIAEPISESPLNSDDGKVVDAQSTKSSLNLFNPEVVGISANFVSVAPATFAMASTESTENPDGYRMVTLTHAFELQATEFTQLQWFLLSQLSQGRLNPTPSQFTNESECDEGSFPSSDENLPPMCKYHPVENISHKDDIQVALEILNENDSVYSYRLATQAEWERAAKGALPAAYNYGFGESFDLRYGWYFGDGPGEADGRTHAVATKWPLVLENGQEIYDLNGNVWEWLEDAATERSPISKVVNPANCPTKNYVEIMSPADTSCDGSNRFRAVRGGSWNSRNYISPLSVRFLHHDVKEDEIGFRLVRVRKNAVSIEGVQ